MGGGGYLEVWDIETGKLDVSIGQYPGSWDGDSESPERLPITIYEFDSSTLETIGVPFEGHTDLINGLALSFDSAVLVSTSDDNTVKL